MADQFSPQIEQLPTNPSSNAELPVTITGSDFDASPLSASEKVLLSHETAGSTENPTLQDLPITIHEEVSSPITNPSPPLLHPVFETLRQNDMGRNILVLVIPIAVFLFTKYSSPSLHATLALTLPVILLSLGFTFIWNGILFRPVLQRASNGIEILGISLVLLAFFGVAAFFLPVYFIWVPFFCWILTLFPITIAFCKRGREEVGDPGRSSIPLLPLSSRSESFSNL